MGRESLKSVRHVALVLLYVSSINANANVVTCTTHSTSNTSDIEMNTEKVQLEIHSNKATSKQKTKTSYFGMFKLLIPDTLR